MKVRARPTSRAVNSVTASAIGFPVNCVNTAKKSIRECSAIIAKRPCNSFPAFAESNIYSVLPKWKRSAENLSSDIKAL